MELSEAERAEIAERLIRTLDAPDPSPGEQARIDEAWVVEIRRRVDAVEAGEPTIPAEQVLAEMRAKLRRKSEDARLGRDKP